jgi:sterol desaturase/sphingolipid hydroxylase (fatty acid hydroxylase superfamily)
MSAAPDLPDIVQLAVPFFLVTMLAELVIGRLTGRARYEAGDTLASLLMGGGNLVEGMLGGAFGFWVLAQAHGLAPLPFAEQAWGWQPWVFVLCFVLDDLRYYWFHRFSHEIRWFWSSHVTHHSSQHYNLSTALRQTWTFTLVGAFVFRLPLVLVGFDPVMVAFVGGINLVYQYWIHTELITRLPRWFEAVFNTPSHHRVHHATNVRYLDRNYAGTLVIWDRLFGTFEVEDREAEPPRYGIVHQLGTLNPLRIAFHELVALLADVVRPGLSLRARLGYAFGPPGWSHDGSRRTATQRKAAAAQPGGRGGRSPSS